MKSGVEHRKPAKRQAAKDKDVRSLVIERVSTLVAMVIRYGSLIWICSYGVDAARCLAGKQTGATFDLLFRIGADRYAAWAAAGIFGYGYFRERKLRTMGVHQHSEYIKSLESTIDPKRSSSKLLTTGEPRKEDCDVGGI